MFFLIDAQGPQRFQRAELYKARKQKLVCAHQQTFMKKNIRERLLPPVQINNIKLGPVLFWMTWNP